MYSYFELIKFKICTVVETFYKDTSYGMCHAENSHILLVCRNREKLLFYFVSFIFVDYIPAWFIVLRIYVALAIHVFQPICDLEAGDNQSLKS